MATGEEKGVFWHFRCPGEGQRRREGGEGCQQDRGTLVSSEHVPAVTMPLSPQSPCLIHLGSLSELLVLVNVFEAKLRPPKCLEIPRELHTLLVCTSDIYLPIAGQCSDYRCSECTLKCAQVGVYAQVCTGGWVSTQRKGSLLQ